ncbi:MAG TPA: hypothetical protein VGI23_25660 [Steroidobacteraceae bacterium]
MSNPKPIILNPQYSVPGLNPQRHRDRPAHRRVLHRIADDVRDNLLDANSIAIDPHRRGVHRKAMVGLAFGEDSGSPPHEVTEIQRSPIQRNLPRHHAPYIEQVIDQPRQVLRLPPDNEPRTRSRPFMPPGRLQHLHRSRDRTQRVAQLMRQHCHEFILRLARLLGTVAIALCKK